MPRSTVRVDFTDEHDVYLARYLAKYSPAGENRSGNALFKDLVANRKNQWPWSVHHPWQSWRQRYVKNRAFFDARIAKYQTKDAEAQKRKSPASSASVEAASPSKKRVRLEANGGEGPSGKRHANAQNTNQTTPKPREPDVQPSTPQRPSTNADQDTPPSSPAPTDDKPLPAKQLKKRSREPSEAPAPASSSSTKDPDPPLQTRSAPSTSVSTYPRAPPRFVNSFDGQVLVDQKGRVPRAFPIENAEEEEEGEGEANEKEIAKDKMQWPQAAKQKKEREPDVEVGNHHAFSQPQATLPLEENADGEQRHPFEIDRRAVAAQFIAEVHVESEGGEDVVRNSASPIVPPASEPHGSPIPKSLSDAPSEEVDDERRHPFELDTHTVDTQLIGEVPMESEHPEGAAANGTSLVKRTAPPPPELGVGPAPKPSKFAAPRPSTASPFGPGVRSLKPQSRVPRIKAARHPALTRIQRQGREEVHVPSVDFVALSRSSASEKSSRSSRTTVRPSRWSLPGFPRVPWVDEHNAASSAIGSRSRSGSGSGVASPFRWRPSILDRDQRASITFTPSPGRPLTTDGAVRSPALTRVALHSTDLDLVCAHGLASFLAHMAANHGLALSVVEEVYGRLGSLSAADEVLKGMREAAQGFGEWEIERRLRRGVERDEDEYSPPETSRAAMWKRREMQHAQEDEAVEEELVREQHDFSRVVLDEGEEGETLVEHLSAQALERQMGRAEFRKEIVKRFV